MQMHDELLASYTMPDEMHTQLSNDVLADVLVVILVPHGVHCSLPTADLYVPVAHDTHELPPK
jgi:hypothetical protein